MGKLLAIARILWILFWIPPFLIFFAISGIFFGWEMKRALWIRRNYIRLINWGIGLRIKVIGSSNRDIGIYVCNHRSFLDPLVVLPFVDSLPIAKAEIADYPFIGIGAKITGVVYVKRENKSSRSSTLDAIKKWIDDAYRILIYPEGTVYNGPTTMEFKSGAFKVAAQEGYKVIPMAAEYALQSDHWPDHQPLWLFSLQVLRKWKTHVTLAIGDPIVSNNHEELLDNTQNWINNELTLIRHDYDESV